VNYNGNNMGLFSASKVVIVEDEASLAEIYKVRLELIGYKCFVAADGLAALSIIREQKPDLVLLDLMIPGLSGGEVLERMRASDWGKDIKVQIISNLNESEAPANLRSNGIVGYTVKANLSNDQIDQLVNNILRTPDQKTGVTNTQ
jgi:DNA-binding response OmpR family regulator